MTEIRKKYTGTKGKGRVKKIDVSMDVGAVAGYIF